jgi:hypothetical protein
MATTAERQQTAMNFLLEARHVDVATLEEIRRTGKTKPRLQTVAIAHGLAYDPHVNGRLRLTPKGYARIRAYA